MFNDPKPIPLPQSDEQFNLVLYDSLGEKRKVVDCGELVGFGFRRGLGPLVFVKEEIPFILSGEEVELDLELL